MKITVKDMMCQHCVMKIDKALKKVGIDCSIDLVAKTVEVVDDKVDSAKVIITNAGYSAE